MKLISVVIPVFNEAANVPPLYESLKEVLEQSSYEWELIFVDDGSTDQSVNVLEELAKKDTRVKSLIFSRNFGKEIALTAGMQAAKGDAVITIDSDLQQPPALIPEFIAKWEEGAEVIVGIRKKVERENFIRRSGSVLFYKVMQIISDVPFIPQSTDFRLLDRKVVDAFNAFTERNRITRGLIDWLGFKTEYVYFDEAKRANGKATYSTFKLVHLALVSVASHSLVPLKLAGYLGLFFFFVFGASGFLMVIAKVFGHPFHLYFSGPAEISVMNGFLISIVLMAMGIMALYIGNMHEEISGRPLFVIRDRRNI